MKELTISTLIASIIAIPALALAYANSQIVNALLGVIWGLGPIGIIVVIVILYQKWGSS
jgi:hypothetical protein